nr:hypothetical protein [Nocardia shimofusensis]
MGGYGEQPFVVLDGRWGAEEGSESIEEDLKSLKGLLGAAGVKDIDICVPGSAFGEPVVAELIAGSVGVLIAAVRVLPEFVKARRTDITVRMGREEVVISNADSKATKDAIDLIERALLREQTRLEQPEDLDASEIPSGPDASGSALASPEVSRPIRLLRKVLRSLKAH